MGSCGEMEDVIMLSNLRSKLRANLRTKVMVDKPHSRILGRSNLRETVQVSRTVESIDQC